MAKTTRRAGKRARPPGDDVPLRVIAWEWDSEADRIVASVNLRDVYGVAAIEGVSQGFTLVHADDYEQHQALVLAPSIEDEATVRRFGSSAPIPTASSGLRNAPKPSGAGAQVRRCLSGWHSTRTRGTPVAGDDPLCTYLTPWSSSEMPC